MNIVSVQDLSQADWDAYHALRLNIRSKYHPAAAADAPVRTTYQFRDRVLASLKTLNGVEYVLFDDRRNAGMGWVRFFPQGDLLSVGADYLADRIPAGFSRLVEQGIRAEMARYKLSKAVAFTDDARLIQAFEHMNHEQSVPFIQLSLNLSYRNEPLLSDWLKNHRFQAEGFSIEATFNYPPDIVQDYLSLQAKLSSDLPLGGQSLSSSLLSLNDIECFRQVQAQNGQVSITLFIVDPSGRRIGYTEVIASRENGTAIQGMTGLLPGFRGMGMAKILKASMLMYLIKEVPTVRRITTTTSPHNPAMLAINKQMGFLEARKSVQFTFDLAQMRNSSRFAGQVGRLA